MVKPYDPQNTYADKDAYKKRKKFALEFSEYFFIGKGTKAYSNKNISDKVSALSYKIDGLVFSLFYFFPVKSFTSSEDVATFNNG
jgi:hypothetical protein